MTGPAKNLYVGIPVISVQITTVGCLKLDKALQSGPI